MHAASLQLAYASLVHVLFECVPETTVGDIPSQSHFSARILGKISLLEPPIVVISSDVLHAVAYLRPIGLEAEPNQVVLLR